MAHRNHHRADLRPGATAPESEGQATQRIAIALSKLKAETSEVTGRVVAVESTVVEAERRAHRNALQRLRRAAKKGNA